MVLFVGTKKQAQEPVAAEATRAGMPYVNRRWLGGMLTNFVTIRKRIGLLEQLEARQAAGDFERLTKKEAAKLTEELNKLSDTLGGIRKMKRLPGAVFVIDPHRERIAVTEANKLEIPLVGTGDTNVDPDELDYIIPANDDAIRSIRLLCSLVADAALEGAQERATRAAAEPAAASGEDGQAEEDGEVTDELVAALAGGGALSFAPDEDDELLPGARPHRAARRRNPPTRRRSGPEPRPPSLTGSGQTTRPSRPAGRDERQEIQQTWRTSRPRRSRTCASGPAPGSWTASAP
jgi:small subunit ribosomal protein S2